MTPTREGKEWGRIGHMTTRPPVPYVFTVEEMLRHFLDHDIEPTPDELGDALSRVGRIPSVTLLVDLWHEDMLTPEAATAHVGSVWSDSEYPDKHADRDDWRGLFRLAGYTTDGKPAERPTEPLVLWRGSVPERRADWSWTDNRQIAEKYADATHFQRPLGSVWRSTVEPWRLLARNTERNEHEYVVDTEGLTITREEDASPILAVRVPPAVGSPEPEVRGGRL